MNYWTRFIKWCQRPGMIKIHTFNPGLGKVDLSRGVKAGAVSGVIYGALLGLILNIGYSVILNGRLDLFMVNFMSDPMDYLGSIIISWVIVFGVIFGSIFGLIFAALYDKLPGKTPRSKGIVTSLIYWFIALLFLPVVTMLYQYGFEGVYWFLTGPWEQSVISLGPTILWGWLLGRFWARERLEKRQMITYRKG